MRLGHPIRVVVHLDLANRQRFDFGPFTLASGAHVLHWRSAWRCWALALQSIELGGLLGHIGGASCFGVSSNRRFLKLAPQKNATSAAACSNGILVPSRVTPSAKVALSSSGNSSSSSSRGEKTGSTRGTHGVAAVQFEWSSLSGWSDRAPLAAARLQTTIAHRTQRSLYRRLGGYIGHRAGQDDLLQCSRLQALHRLEHRVFDLRQARCWMRLAPGNHFTSHRVAQRPPPRKLSIPFLLIHLQLSRSHFRQAGASLYRITQNCGGHRCGATDGRPVRKD